MATLFGPGHDPYVVRKGLISPGPLSTISTSRRRRSQSRSFGAEAAESLRNPSKNQNVAFFLGTSIDRDLAVSGVGSQVHRGVVPRTAAQRSPGRLVGGRRPSCGIAPLVVAKNCALARRRGVLHSYHSAAASISFTARKQTKLLWPYETKAAISCSFPPRFRSHAVSKNAGNIRRQITGEDVVAETGYPARDAPDE